NLKSTVSFSFESGGRNNQQTLIREPQIPTGVVWLQQLCNVGRCLTMQGSESDYQNLELDPEIDEKPV
ncbi:hypothetical protein DVA81_19895, partial [Acinetobacter baumannii]